MWFEQQQAEGKKGKKERSFEITDVSTLDICLYYYFIVFPTISFIVPFSPLVYPSYLCSVI